MKTAVRKIQFCAGHRVMEHGSKCRNMHGHNYVAFIHARAEQLDRLGMVIDFGVLKAVVGEWIDANWDHGFIYYARDIAVERALAKFERMENDTSTGVAFGQKAFALESNPTAENMASFLLCKANELLAGHGVEVFKIDLWETENCYATAELEPVFSPGLRRAEIMNTLLK